MGCRGSFAIVIQQLEPELSNVVTFCVVGYIFSSSEFSFNMFGFGIESEIVNHVLVMSKTVGLKADRFLV